MVHTSASAMFFWLISHLIFQVNLTNSNTFRAAVYDKPTMPIPFYTNNFSRAILNETLKIYRQKVEDAHKAVRFSYLLNFYFNFTFYSPQSTAK